ncbi:MAG: hypothetical protein DRO00_09820, partial [Thermoproteota archaeon]
MSFFSKEAEEAINSYLEKLERKIDELGFEIDEERRKDFILAVNHSLRLFSIRHARKRGSKVVKEKDARASFRFLSPERVIKHGLISPETFLHLEKLRRKHLKVIREKLASTDKPKILDAGCQYGRQLMEFLRRGWRADFFGVDIDIEAITYGRSVEPSISFIGADIQGKLPFRDNVFDAIVCMGVLHFM